MTRQNCSLLCVPSREEFRQRLAKSGNTYNHKLVWEYVKPPKCNKPFDYYPRGRVDFTPKGKPVVYMNKHIGNEYIPEIIKKFGLTEEPIIRIDGSNHYRCHLDG